jgi:DNA polymerase-1
MMPDNNSKIKELEGDKVVLIDSNALIHRSFHAVPQLKTHNGILTNAVYGFASTVLRVLEDLKPRYIVATFDVSKDTFRRKLYKEYKAQRVAAPQELYDQIPMVKEICNILNIPIFAVDGYEADDVIGTIVHKLKTTRLDLQKARLENLKLINNCVILNDSEESRDPSQAQNDNQPKKPASPEASQGGLQANPPAAGIKSYIVTGDKDTYQLVDENTFVYSIIKGLKNVEIIDNNYVLDKYGFGPELIIDYKALRGDPSDNIPGVPGIGEVTAKKLIVEYGTIENLYNQIKTQNEKLKTTTKNLKNDPHESLVCHPELVSGSDKISNNKSQITNKSQFLNSKLITKLMDNKEQAFLSKVLSTIKLDVPLDFDLGCCLVHDYDKEKALKLFNKLEFKSLIPRLPDQHSRHEQNSLF